jgi:hypothetical protein
MHLVLRNSQPVSQYAVWCCRWLNHVLVPNPTTSFNMFERQRTWLRHRGQMTRMFESAAVQEVLARIGAEVDGKVYCQHCHYCQ